MSTQVRSQGFRFGRYRPFTRFSSVQSFSINFQMGKDYGVHGRGNNGSVKGLCRYICILIPTREFILYRKQLPLSSKFLFISGVGSGFNPFITKQHKIKSYQKKAHYLPKTSFFLIVLASLKDVLFMEFVWSKC